jgi:hypothetical protein
MCREPKVLNCELLAKAKTGDGLALVSCLEQLLAVMDKANMHLAGAHLDLAVQMVRKQLGISLAQ